MARGYPGQFGRVAGALWCGSRCASLRRALRAPAAAAVHPTSPSCSPSASRTPLRAGTSRSRCRRVSAARLPAHADALDARRPGRPPPRVLLRRRPHRRRRVPAPCAAPPEHRRRQRDRRRLRGRVGADRLLHGERLYGAFPPTAHGDTYGPALYPVRPVRAAGRAGELGRPARGRAAAVAFDFACIGGLWLAGRRLGGPRLGLLLAYLWVTFPFTLLVANSAPATRSSARRGRRVPPAWRPARRGGRRSRADSSPRSPCPARGARRPSRAPLTSARRPAALLLVPAATTRGADLLDAPCLPRPRASPFSVWGLRRARGCRPR